MDYEKLIDKLRTESLYKDKATLEIMDLCMDAAEALSAWPAENEKLRSELEQVKRERGAAVEQCRGYCDSCAFVGDCAKHDLNDSGPTRWYYGDCEDWEWRGPKED